jgi:acyl-CoA hydrolase
MNTPQSTSIDPHAHDPAHGVPLPTDKELVLKVIPMPADCNANGDIFGGWVLSQMDLAGGIAGVERAQGRVVTIAVDAMTFIRPVKVGDVLRVVTRSGAHVDYDGWGPFGDGTFAAAEKGIRRRKT